jgi:ketosteroid isomerase-like protein
VGIDAYQKTWENFLYALEKGTHAFQVIDLHVFAGTDVAFCHSPMRCVYHDGKGRVELDFRLTIGFKKMDGEWWFIHEHHSVPAEEN